MDLALTPPRSPNEEVLGIVSLGRTIDKARAFTSNTLGEYHYNCPHDQALFAFLGVDARTFASRVAALDSDEAIEAWVAHSLLSSHTKAQRAAFNAERRAWAPQPHTKSAQYFAELHARVAPDRAVRTWFELLELEEQQQAELLAA